MWMTLHGVGSSSMKLGQLIGHSCSKVWSCRLHMDDSAYFNFAEVISWVIGRHHTIKFSQDEDGRLVRVNRQAYKQIEYAGKVSEGINIYQQCCTKCTYILQDIEINCHVVYGLVSECSVPLLVREWAWESMGERKVKNLQHEHDKPY